MIEIHQFRLRPDADESVFIEADARVQQTYFYAQRGIRRRTTARSRDGQWLAMCHWDNDDCADAAAQRAFPGEFSSLAPLVDLDTVTTDRFFEL